MTNVLKTEIINKALVSLFMENGYKNNSHCRHFEMLSYSDTRIVISWHFDSEYVRMGCGLIFPKVNLRMLEFRQSVFPERRYTRKDANCWKYVFDDIQNHSNEFERFSLNLNKKSLNAEGRQFKICNPSMDIEELMQSRPEFVSNLQTPNCIQFSDLKQISEFVNIVVTDIPSKLERYFEYYQAATKTIEIALKNRYKPIGVAFIYLELGDIDKCEQFCRDMLALGRHPEYDYEFEHLLKYLSGFGNRFR